MHVMDAGSACGREMLTRRCKLPFMPALGSVRQMC